MAECSMIHTVGANAFGACTARNIKRMLLPCRSTAEASPGSAPQLLQSLIQMIRPAKRSSPCRGAHTTSLISGISHFPW